MGVKLQSALGGSVEINAPSTASSYTITAPAISGTMATNSGTSTDNAIVRFDGTGGAVQNSGCFINDSGNLGVGTSSPSLKLSVNGDFWQGNGGEVELGRLFNDVGVWHLRASSNVTGLAFGTANTERMRLDASGNLLVGTTSGATNRFIKDSSGGVALQVSNSSATNTSSAMELNVNYTGNTSGWFVRGGDNSIYRFYIYSNGNMVNSNNSYGAISDVRLKENITDATPKLAQLQQVRVVNYNLIGDTQKQIGVIAQELEQIFPSMVEEASDRDAEGNDLGTTTKSVKYSVFVPMLIKAIQEQQAIITELKARIEILEGQA